MYASFESEKNRKALIYTAIICGILLLLAFIIRWQYQLPTPPVVQDLLEINLGNDKEGYGDIQPLIKGEMGSVEEASASTASQPVTANTEESAIQPEDNNMDNEAASVVKSEKISKNKPVSPTQANTKPVKSNTPPAIVPPTPRPQKPLNTYKGTGNGGGNGAAEDNGYRYQGNKPGGTGDAGSPGGKPDSYGNTPGGKSGVSVTRGVRPLNLGALRFEDNFNENAKVYLDVKYNSNGTVVSYTISKGTTTANTTIIGIAKRKAAELKFPSGDGDGGVSTILFNFKVQN